MTLKKIFEKIFILSLVLILFSGCSDKTEKSDAYGNFEADEIIVSSEVSGKIIKFEVEEGDILKKNQPVCYIDDYPIKLKKDELAAQKKISFSKISNIVSQVKVIEEQKQNLVNDKNRFLKMLAESAATQKQVDDIIGQINVFDKQIENVLTQKVSAQNEIELIDIKIAQIQDQIDRCIIKNPADGTVINKYAEEGEICGPTKPVYKLANLERMYLKAYISEKQLSSVKLGEEAEVIIDNAKNETRRYRGKIIYVSDKSEFTPKTIQTKEERVKLVYAIKVSVKNDGYIKIGMPGEIKFR
ncbi:efflux RND transporter periplasmic adaptor subunit [Candidatus Dependentiae bacterium]|nr:efflux RND transporter periplasmic adaptor subunit [Candidatus Dependentiae bacterium]